MYIQRHRRREIVRMSPIPTPPIEGYASYIATISTVDGSALFSESPLSLELLKSLDDLDEEEDKEDDDDEGIEDLDEEEDDDDLEDDYDEDDDEEEDEDDEEEDDDEDGGVKPLRMA
jgi:hypothetical protein